MDKQIYETFRKPPEGYGEVAFFWWNGDKLTKEKLGWILEQLDGYAISGIQINYAHSNLGGAVYGLTLPSDPPLFTTDWWELVAWFSEQCKKRGISVSLSDYTLGTPGQGWFADEMIQKYPELKGQILVYENDKVEIKTVNKSYNPIAKGVGEVYAKVFWGKFETYFPNECGKTFNFFFSDELSFNVSGNLWCDDFEEQFKKRKGYDLMPLIKGIFVDIGDITPKVRLDYYDVIVQLSEERYFRKLYQWHEERGMIFGCDHGGRGRDVREFGDYFRTMKWYQGPGCDQPKLYGDLIKNKVASSISHLYERPRTWLEGFYSSGWGTSTADLLDAVYRNFVMGHNLLSLHGMYYTTYGSMWEWAPPCNHHHMPYWKHMKEFLQCTERLSYLLSQGKHKCDVAVLYPVAPLEVGPEGQDAVDTAFETAEMLYAQGIDFDFMDFESILRCDIQNGKLCIAGEQYKVLILPSMRAVRFSMMEQILRFAETGGIVINIGDKPVMSDRAGANDEVLNDIVNRLFLNNAYQADTCGDAAEIIKRLGIIDFIAPKGAVPYFQHRIAEDTDIYFVYHVPKGEKCFFKAKGKPHLLDPFTGQINAIQEYTQKEDGTLITMPLEQTELHIIVFDDTLAAEPIKSDEEAIVWKAEGVWECELQPTLDNRYGDYRLPAFDGFIGAEARRTMVVSDDMSVRATNSYGTYFYRLGALPSDADERILAALRAVNGQTKVEIDGKEYFFSPYRYSLRYGVENRAGNQKSFHGLKGILSDDFILLGKMIEPEWHYDKYEPEEAGNIYYFWTTVYCSQACTGRVVTGDIAPAKMWINHHETTAENVPLQKGTNYILLKYDRSGRTHFMIQKQDAKLFIQTAPLSMYWYHNPNYFVFDAQPDHAGKQCTYRFTTPPGMKSITFSAIGKPGLTVNGEAVPLQKKEDTNQYTAEYESVESVTAELRIIQERGYYGASALPEPIRFKCGKGIIPIGDWSTIDSLECYSGGMWYRKTFRAVNAEQKVILDLGTVVSTAEVYVNGHLAGIKIAPPWKLDISQYIVPGENRIEILVFNTAANQFDTSPTFYKGSLKSGILG